MPHPATVIPLIKLSKSLNNFKGRKSVFLGERGTGWRDRTRCVGVSSSLAILLVWKSFIRSNANVYQAGPIVPDRFEPDNAIIE